MLSRFQKQMLATDEVMIPLYLQQALMAQLSDLEGGLRIFNVKEKKQTIRKLSDSMTSFYSIYACEGHSVKFSLLSFAKCVLSIQSVGKPLKVVALLKNSIVDGDKVKTFLSRELKNSPCIRIQYSNLTVSGIYSRRFTQKQNAQSSNDTISYRKNIKIIV